MKINITLTDKDVLSILEEFKKKDQKAILSAIKNSNFEQRLQQIIEDFAQETLLGELSEFMAKMP